MPLFQYSKICFSYDMTDLQKSAIPVAIIAEWNDGDFWKIALCASESMTPEDFEKLSGFAKTYMSDPFDILYQTIDIYIKERGWHQKDSVISKFLKQVFTTQYSLYSECLFQQAVSAEESMDEIFDDIAQAIPGRTRVAIWHRIDPDQVTSVDGTKLVE